MSNHTTLTDEHAAELGEMLEFLFDWTHSAPETISAALAAFTAGGYTLAELRVDLARFAFVLGGDPSRLFIGAEE